MLMKNFQLFNGKTNIYLKIITMVNHYLYYTYYELIRFSK